MRYFHAILLTFGLMLCSGCSKQSPVAEGEVVSGTIWDFPRTLITNNTGNPIEQGSFVAVYPTLIIITAKDGTKRVVPLDQVNDLRLK